MYINTPKNLPPDVSCRCIYIYSCLSKYYTQRLLLVFLLEEKKKRKQGKIIKVECSVNQKVLCIKCTCHVHCIGKGVLDLYSLN